MTIAELKTLIANIPDDVPVGVTDHFGRFEEIDASDCDFFNAGEHKFVPHAFFRLPNVDIGPEPE